MKKYLAIVVLCCLIISCDWDTRLNLFNHSTKKLRYTWDIMDISDTIPDDLYCERTNPYELIPLQNNNLTTQNRWNLVLKDEPTKILRIFIIDEDTLEKYGTCEVYHKYMFKKRIDLTYEDFLKLNWRIDYYDK